MPLDRWSTSFKDHTSTEAEMGKMERWIARVSTLIIGGVLGALGTVLFFTAGEFVSRSAIMVAIPLAVAFVALYAVFRRVVMKEVERRSASWKGDTQGNDGLPTTIAEAAEQLLPEGTRNREYLIKKLSQAAAGAEGVSRILAAIWGASASLAAAIALTGAVVSMATLVALYQQIERLDLQNTLLARQTEEATAARVSATFSAQLIPLLAEIEEARPKSPNEEWDVSRLLLTRIQSVIDLAEPYTLDPDVDRWIREVHAEIWHQSISEVDDDIWIYDSLSNDGIDFSRYRLTESFLDGELRPRLYSPERARLFQILFGMEFPFEEANPPLDFSFMDARDLDFDATSGISRPEPNDDDEPLYSLGRTKFTGANFKGGWFNGVDLSSVDFGGSILPFIETGDNAIYKEQVSADTALANRPLGINLLFSISPAYYWDRDERMGSKLGALRRAGGYGRPEDCITSNEDPRTKRIPSPLSCLEGYSEVPWSLWNVFRGEEFDMLIPSRTTETLEAIHTALLSGSLTPGTRMGLLSMSDNPEDNQNVFADLTIFENTPCEDDVLSALRLFTSSNPPDSAFDYVVKRLGVLLPKHLDRAVECGILEPMDP